MKNKKFWIIGVLVIVGIILVFLGGLYIFNGRKSSQKEVDSIVLSDLLNTLAIDKADSRNLDLYHALFNGEKYVEISKLSQESQYTMIGVYAGHNSMYEKVSGKDYSMCDAGPGYCDAVNADNLNKILSKYDFGREKNQIIDNDLVYNNMYLFTIGGWYVEYETINHDISTEYDNSDIIVWDNVTLTLFDKKEEKQKISYRFKTIDNKNYYLYSIKLS